MIPLGAVHFNLRRPESPTTLGDLRACQGVKGRKTKVALSQVKSPFYTLS